ncbi:MAG: hypothetical protein MJ246_04870 [Clostridia bacterium]|nr:hypothetical protein [Clostridia bacterium]
MKNISKRIVALVLAVAMMITSLPTIASAATKTPSLNGKGLMKWKEKQTLEIENSKVNREFHGIKRDKRTIISNIE